VLGRGSGPHEPGARARVPVAPRPDRFPRTRIVTAAAAVVVLAALGVALLGGFGGRSGARSVVRASPGQPMPPPWKLSVDVLNGGGDIYYTRALASKVGALGYKIRRGKKANRFGYPDTAVYFEPRGDADRGRPGHPPGGGARPRPPRSKPPR